MDLGDIVADCGSLGLPAEVGALELARDGGGLKSIDALSLSGDVGGNSTGGSMGGGTIVASDLILPDLCRASDCGGGTGFSASSFVPFSSASSVISTRRRRRRELDEEVTEVEAVCKRHADDKALSVRSEALVKGRTVSFGVNLSVTDWN
jgi:hypothetical protein